MEEEDLVDALKRYGRIRDMHERVTTLQKALGVQFRKATQEILPEMFEEEGVSSITVDG